MQHSQLHRLTLVTVHNTRTSINVYIWTFNIFILYLRTEKIFQTCNCFLKQLNFHKYMDSLSKLKLTSGKLLVLVSSVHASLVDWIHQIPVHINIVIFGIWLLMLCGINLILAMMIHLVLTKCWYQK